MSSDPNALNRLRIDRSAVKQRSFPWGIALLVILLLLGGAYGLWHWATRPKPVAVRTVQVQVAKGSTNVLLNASGYVTARRAATVSSKVSGKVLDVLTEEGQRVEAGQILAHVDDTNTVASLRLAEAQLESARRSLDEIGANLALAETELLRSYKLQAKDVLSQSEIDRTDAETRALRARFVRQKADIQVAERQVAIWQQQIDDAVIRAPFAGVVTSKNAQPGEIISPMSAGGGFTRTGICTVVDMTSLEVEVDVNESYIQRVLAGQPATAVLDSYPDWKIPSKVIAIIPTADRQKASVKVRVGFNQLDPRILPDMGVKVAFEGSATEANAQPRVTIPANTLRSREGRDIVFVVQGGRVESRAVGVGQRNGDTLTITAGLRGGETLVLEPPVELVDGATISEPKS